MTIGEKLKVKNYPFEVTYNEGASTYLENDEGYWEIVERDEEGNVISYETSRGFITEYEYKDGKTFFETKRV
jgi:hypothetical protein